MYELKLLAQLLQKELTCQNQLIGVLENERAAVVKLDRAALETLARDKEAVLVQASSVAKRRDDLMDKLYLQLGLEAPKKLAKLISACGASKEEKRELQELVEELRLVAKRVQGMNDYNSLLIRQTLGVVSSTISIFRSSITDELPTYQKTGSLREPGSEVPARTFVSRSA